VVDCGNAGTGVRLIMGAAAGFAIAATFTGDASLRGRPMMRVLKPLGEMGANGAITPNRAELPDSAFSKLDTGSKGYLTRDDTRSLGGFDFNAHDLNHDGRLTADEFSQAWQRYSGNANPGASTGINGTGNATGGTGGMSGSTNGSTSGGAMAPRGGGVGATTRTNESSRTTTGTPMDSTSPAPASSGSTAK